MIIVSGTPPPPSGQQPPTPRQFTPDSCPHSTIPALPPGQLAPRSTLLLEQLSSVRLGLGPPIARSWALIHGINFPKRQILDSSKLREFADANFKFA